MSLKLFDFMLLFSGSSFFSKVRTNCGGGGVRTNWRVYTAKEKPAALMNRWTVSRHEGPACGDPGSVDETEVGRGGLGAQKESLEEPPTAGGGPQSMADEASKGR